MAERPDSLLKTIKANFKAVCDVESTQRANEKEDLEFQDPENQWDAAAKKYRKGRPMLSVSLLEQPMTLVQNQAAAAHLAVQVHPVSEKADPKVAEVKQDLYRRIERDSNASQARLWALDRAKQCGRGWYRVNTQWDEDGDNEWDQEIVIERILYQDSVYVDPSAQKPDFSDANWAIVATWVPVEQFKEDYPGKLVPQNPSEFKLWSEQDPDWVMAGGEVRAVLVVEYWWKEKGEKKTIERPDGKLKRQKASTVVKWALATAKEVLEEQPWDGRYIPLVPVFGKELQPYDGKRAWEGMVRKARGAQKYFNFAISNEVEAMATEPKMPWIGAEGQFKGHEEEWEQSNVRNQPYLEYKPVTFDGTMAPPPQRAQIDSSKIMLSHQAALWGRDLVQMATNVYAASLGDLPRETSKQSGKAILALQQQSDAGTSNYIQTLAEVSMLCEARIVLDLMDKKYDRPGRVVQVLGEEGDPRFVMLNQPYTEDENGRPQPIPPGMPPPEGTKVYDLKRGKYTVSVQIGKSAQTRMQEGANEIGQILQAAPQLTPLLGATYFRFRDFPGAKEIADILKKVREQQIPGLSGEDGQPTVEQLKAQMAQMQQQGQMQQMQLQQAMQALQTEQAKQQASIEKARMEIMERRYEAQLKSDTELRKSAADSETKLAIAGLAAQQAQILEVLKLEREAREAEKEAANDARDQDFEREKMDRAEVQSAADRFHQTQQSREQMAGKAGMEREKQGVAVMEGREQRQHETETGREGRADAAALDREKRASAEQMTREQMAHEGAMAAMKPQGRKTE